MTTVSIHTPAAAAKTEPSLPAVSWHAVLAGATGAAALSLVLLILGTGLGLASISPFTGKGASAATFGMSTIAWLTFTQLAAAGLGGYLAGRLRARWSAVHNDEVYFRDTAHGFLTWAVATLLAAGLFSAAINSIVGARTVEATGQVIAAEGDAETAGSAASMGYFVDRMFRSNASAAGITSEANPITPIEAAHQNAEAARILVTAMDDRGLERDDVSYLGQLVSKRTGLEQSKAEERVQEIVKNLKTRSDAIRKKSAYVALWLFVSLLIGAFVASLAATFGGRQRDLI